MHENRCRKPPCSTHAAGEKPIRKSRRNEGHRTLSRRHHCHAGFSETGPNPSRHRWAQPECRSAPASTVMKLSLIRLSRKQNFALHKLRRLRSLLHRAPCPVNAARSVRLRLRQASRSNTAATSFATFIVSCEDARPSTASHSWSWKWERHRIDCHRGGGAKTRLGVKEDPLSAGSKTSFRPRVAIFRCMARFSWTFHGKGRYRVSPC